MFVVRSIPNEVVVAARNRLASGDPATTTVIADSSPGYPCRRCLRDGAIGDEMLLFSYSPFDAPGPYFESGPVLVHALGCESASLRSGEIPDVSKVRERCVVRAYDQREWIYDGVLVETSTLASSITAFLNDEAVAKVHVRNVEYGCFAYEVRRS